MSINQDVDESLSVGESSREVLTPYVYGVTGSAPLQDYSSRINVLLCDAIKAKWDSATYPTADDMLWLTTWFVGKGDAEIIFRLGYEDKPIIGRSTDWRFQPHVTTVDVHVFCQGKGGDIEPPLLNTVVTGLDKIVALNHTTLIPNAVIEVASTQAAPSEKEDDLQSLWHVLIKMRVVYYKVRTL